MRKRLLSAGMAAALFVLTLITVISAAKVYELAFQNKLSTGSVDIDLKTLSVSEDGSLKDVVERDVYPGERLSYMPMIKNKRADAYVRVKIDVTMDQETEEPVTSKNVYQEVIKVLTEDDVFQTIDSSDWVQKGDYFYNTKVMKQGEKSYAFQGIIIPANWVVGLGDSLPAIPPGTDPARASGFTIALHADAIQAENFSPDFSSDHPWGSVETEQAKEEDGADYSIASPVVTQNEMTFKGSGGLEANTKDLFRNIQRFNAGTIYEDSLEIRNASSNGITVYFRTKNTASYLKAKMRLKIEMEGKTIYDGDLTSSSLSEYRELVKLKAGKDATLKYTVLLPDDSLNSYSVLSDEVEWDFKVVVDESGRKTGTPRTGDTMAVVFWALTLLISVAIMGYLIRREKKQKKMP